MTHTFGYVLGALLKHTWCRALLELAGAPGGDNDGGDDSDNDGHTLRRAYLELYRSLCEAGARGLPEAVAEALLYADTPLSRAASGSLAELPDGLRRGAVTDIETLLPLVRRDWQRHVGVLLSSSLPPLAPLAAPPHPEVGALAVALCTQKVAEVLERLLEHYACNGGGDLARFPAFRWSGGALQGIAHPERPDAAQLVGVERALEKLFSNTETFLAGGRAQHALLYGPRGSGKSTALKSLGPRYAERGLRLVEVPPEALGDLPEVLAALRGRPHRYLLFADDLSFGPESAVYAPLKSLLEGSLAARPDNVLLYATSNRRHLVAERFSDRPDPLNDDVHAWDTQHERLALADRFGLTITFPDATQKRYLEIVRGLAEQGGLEVSDEAAIRFAEWGNGYSGRTAQQFLEVLKSGLV